MKVISFILILISLSILTISIYISSKSIRDYVTNEYSKVLLRSVCNEIVGEISFKENFKFKIIKEINIPKKIFKYRYEIYGREKNLICEIPEVYKIEIFVNKTIKGRIISTLKSYIIITNENVTLISIG